MQKTKLLFLFLLFLGTIQAQTLSYRASNAGGGYTNVTAEINGYLSTDQQSVMLQMYSDIYNGINWTGTGNYDYYVNNTLIGSSTSSTTNIDISAYIPVSSVKIVSKAHTWSNVVAQVIITPTHPLADGPDATDITLCKNSSAQHSEEILTGNGVALKWFTSELGEGYSASPSTTTVGTTTYYVSQKDNAGAESKRSSITVTVIEDQLVLTCPEDKNLINPISQEFVETEFQSFVDGFSNNSENATPGTFSAYNKGFGGAYAVNNWTNAALPSGSYFNQTASKLDIGANKTDAVVTRQITIPSDGIISFEWEAMQTGADGFKLSYFVNDNETLLADGNGSGYITDIAVNEGDILKFSTSGDTQNATYLTTISNFRHEYLPTATSVIEGFFTNDGSVVVTYTALNTCDDPISCTKTFSTERQTLSYSAGNSGGGSSNVTAEINGYLSTDQQSVMLQMYSDIFNGSSWTGTGNYDYYVNNTLIGSSTTSATNIDISAYIPVSSVKVVSRAATWSTVAAQVIITPTNPLADGPDVTEITYCKNTTAEPLEAGLNGTGVALKWYTSESGGGYSASAPTPSTTTAGTTTYYVSQTDDAGVESKRSIITVVVEDQLVLTCPEDKTLINPLSQEFVETEFESFLYGFSNNSISNTISIFRVFNNGFTGAYAANNWTNAAQPSGSYFEHTASKLDIGATGSDEVNSRQLTIPADGFISFDWETTQTGDDGFNLSYFINGYETYLSFGDGSGSETDIYVNKGDVFEFSTWGDTQNAIYLATITNFKHEYMKIDLSIVDGFFINDGSVSATYSAQNLCGMTESCTKTFSTVKNTTANSQLSNKESVRYYPNPTKGEVSLDIEENATLYIYSIEGKVMKTQRLTEGTNSVDMYDFKAGIYSFRVITNNDVKTFKVIKE
jgi:hypothetical protein